MNDKLKKLIDHNATVPSLIGLLSFGGGVTVGYFFAHKLLKSKTEEDSLKPNSEKYEAELAKIREAVEKSRAERATRKPPPVIIDAEERELVKEYQTDQPKVEVIEPTIPEPEAPVTVNEAVVDHNIFASAEDGWDMDEEVRHRTTERPYVVHRDEFFEEGNDDYNQRQLTYYNGDDTLVDEDNHPIENHIQVVGEMKFGHGSGDPNVVYIRNERLQAEYEIFLEAGQYRIDILGQGPDSGEVKHSKVKRMPRET